MNQNKFDCAVKEIESKIDPVILSRPLKDAQLSLKFHTSYKEVMADIDQRRLALKSSQGRTSP